MALYYLDSEDEPRACPKCNGDGRQRVPYALQERIHADYEDCSVCRGTGHLGKPEKQPDLMVDRLQGQRGFGFYFIPKKWVFAPLSWWNGPHPTESAAVEAARKAMKKVSR